MTVQPYAAPPAWQPGPAGAAVYQPQQVQQGRQAQGLSFWFHGWAKAGKSNLADSGPRPTVVLDAEGGAFWTQSRKRYWDPLREPVPDPGRHLTAGYGQPSITPSWETAIAIVQEAATVSQVYKILRSGRHPFKSTSLDSVTEVQQRVIDDLAGIRKIERDQWGALLRQVNSMLRQFRDLIHNPVNPLWSVAFVSGTSLDQRIGKLRPLIQGQAKDYLPYYVDILGYIEAQADGTRNMLIGPSPHYETGERVGGRLPYSLQLGYPGRPGYTIESMLMQVLAPRGRS